MADLTWMTGEVEAVSSKGNGLQMVGHGKRWYNYTKLENRNENFDLPEKGDIISAGCTVWKDSYWINEMTIKGGNPQAVQDVPEIPFQENAEPVDAHPEVTREPVETAPPMPEPPPDMQEWGYKQKDALIFKETCINAARDIYAACIAAGLIKEKPLAEEIHSYAETLESMGWDCLRR